MKTALIMAGGTGGHIFPGLAVAQALRERGWQVRWLGAPNSMEARLVPERGFALEQVEFSGVRGKGLVSFALLPLRLLKAFWQSFAVLRRIQPDVVVGLGGYITFPAGMMAVLCGKPLILHEQNTVAGMANKVLAGVADRIFTSFPGVFAKGEWIGNPLRQEFLAQAAPQERFAGRSGRMKLLVLGGSLGASALNDIIPKALAAMPVAQRPEVIHQGGDKQIDQLRANYAASGVTAELTAFIADTAKAMADADVVICRAGASTVSEIAAVGAPAVFVPFPFAVDDHQTHNARFLSDQGAASLLPQEDLTIERIVAILSPHDVAQKHLQGVKAYACRKIDATEKVVQACEALGHKKI